MESPRRPWKKYYEATKEQPIRKLLASAVELVPTRDAALELGAGSLRDARYLLDSGFKKVVAVDNEPAVAEIAKKIEDERLEVCITTFEEYDFPETTFDLVSAQYALPFTHPQFFDTVFQEIRSSLKSGGILSGQLFGKNDGWSDRNDMSFHSLTETEELLAGMEILTLEEEERDAPTALGEMKHWDIIRIIARK